MVKVLQEEPTVTALCISWYGFLIMTEYGVVVAGHPFLTAWWRCINQMIFSYLQEIEQFSIFNTENNNPV